MNANGHGFRPFQALNRTLSRREALRSAALVGASALASYVPSAAAAPSKGGTLRLAMSDSKSGERLDPWTASNGSITLLSPLLYEPLVRHGKDLSLHPCLAERWEPNAPATEWKFSLRKGVKFHDGSPFTAADVVYNLQKTLDPKVGSALRKRLAASFDAEGIQVVDDHTVVLKLKRPDTLLPHALARTYGGIVKRGITPTTDVRTAIGTGPFKVKSFQPGQSWEVVRFDQYWVPELPYLDGIQFVTIPDQSAKVQALLSGAIDMIDQVDPVVGQQLLTNASVRACRLPSLRLWGIFLSQEVKPFDDVRVRKAVKLAMDRKLILNSVYHGQGSATPDVPVPPTDPLFPASLGERPQNLEEARKLLAEAGLPNGFEFELFTSPARPGMVDIAVTFAEAVKAVGIKAKINQWPTATYWDQIWGKRPAYIDFIGRRIAHDMIDVTFAKDGPFNGSKFDSDGSLRALIDKALGETDEGRRNDMYKQALVKIGEDASCPIPIFQDQLSFVRKNIQGNPYEYEDPFSFYLLSKSA